MSPAPQASGMRIVGSRVKVLVDAINDFRKLGVDNVVTLPELVLIGDQSAGKSSLMGALAEIHLPRSSGCCTRCPAHIKTSPALQWNCKISLQKQYSYEPKAGKLLDPKDVTRSHPFPPWVELASSEIKQFKTIYHKNDLEEVLKWAQIATLNPDTEHTRYVPGHENFLDDESTQAKFSPNVVSVEISGPGLPSLSFYDLPGIFQNAGHKEDQYLVKVIENLAAKYIKHPEALIICALPMSADPATSRTAKVISDLKADKRCIGVLTKADQLQEGQSYEEFFKLLQGREHVVGHGYYVTKQPVQSANDKAVLNYHKNARDQEEHFFRTNYPWCKDWDQFRDRFGTINLQLALSQKFAQQIAARY
jgi:GTPase SAR1 family protein